MDAEPVAAADLEEPLRDLLHLCEGLRAVCALGEQRGLKLADAEPVAMLAAQVAAEVLRQALRRPAGAAGQDF